jgi:hypothetical protein
MRYRVIKDWQATYEDPIVLKAGDPVWLSGRIDKWDGYIWVWAKNADEKEGWIPDDGIKNVNGCHFACEDFSALELTCHASQVLTALKKTKGWVLCKDRNGNAGWVPEKNLQPE